MHIESKIKREGGSHIDMGTAKYHFAPQADGAHVAEVLDEAHQDRFLSISEGYRLYRPGQAPAPAVIVLGAAGFEAAYTFGDKQYSFDDIVGLAHKASGLDTDEWNGMEEESRAGLIEEQLDLLADAADDAPAAPKKKQSAKK